MRLASIVIISIVFAVTGQYIAYILKERIHLLERINHMISYISNQINYSFLPVNELVGLISQKDDFKNLAFIRVCKSYLEKGYDFPSAWKKSLKNKSCTHYLKHEDIEVLIEFGESFGITDVEGQLSYCKLYSDLIKTKIIEAQSIKEQYSGVVSSLGFLLALGFIIVFI